MNIRIIAICISVLVVVSVRAEEAAVTPDKEADTEALAKAAQNPIANMISLPFQNNTNFNVGPKDEIQNILNIQPVIPIKISSNLNLITRTILPVISQPGPLPGMGRKSGIGDVQLSMFFSPADSGKLIWGVGPIFQLPTASETILGSKKWCAGPTGVALISDGPWVAGALINNIWDFAGDKDRSHVNQMLVQPFINYNFRSSPGTYLTMAPIITANWEARNRDRWVVPIGMGLGQIFKIGTQPINASLQGYYNVVTPRQGADWSVRLQIQFLFPK